MKLTTFMDATVDHLQTVASCSTVGHYETTLRRILSYHGENISLSVLFRNKWLTRFQKHLKICKLHRNSIVFYMRILHALYNIALEQQLLKPVKNLFSGILLTYEKTEKRSLTAETVLFIAEADLSDHAKLEVARDMFILSILLQGMPYIDLACLLKTDLESDNIRYQRHKTGATVVVALTNQARAIIEKYKHSDSPYLLPLLKHTTDPVVHNRNYSNSLRNYNRHLKKIASLLGINVNLSSYVCRHTWATLAHHQGVAMSVISQALGHSKEETTQTYVKSLPSHVFLRANEIVEKAIFASKEKEVHRKKSKKTALETSKTENVHL